MCVTSSTRAPVIMSSLSCDDRKFLQIKENGFHKNASENWEMPLPFRRQDAAMPNNQSQAVHQLNGLLKTLKQKPQMKIDYLKFMEKVINKGHASPVPPEDIQAQSGRVWYLPHFGEYHPKKPTKIRMEFDSSTEFEGVSLNKELLAGPDLMNSLLGVLIRFHKENVAVMCDIKQMFHSFHVDPAHRNYLRFLWFQDNDIFKFSQLTCCRLFRLLSEYFIIFVYTYIYLRFEFIRAVGTEIMPIMIQRGQELTGKVLKHITGNGPIYIRARKYIPFNSVS